MNSKFEFSQNDLIDIINRSRTIYEYLDLKPFSSSRKNKYSDDLISQKLENWCEIAADRDWEKFQKRLAWDNLDINNAYTILVTQENSSQQTAPQKLPKWIKVFENIIKEFKYFSWENLDDKYLKNILLQKSNHELIPFQEIYLSIIQFARKELSTQMSKKYHLLSEEAHLSLEKMLLIRLRNIFSLTLETKFFVFLGCTQPIDYQELILNSQQYLKSKEYKKNINEFTNQLLQGEIVSLFYEYPVLARLIATVTQFWIESNVEFIQRLEADWSDIQETFSPDKTLKQIIGIETSLSDFHHKGRSVIIMQFDSQIKVVYKPRGLGLDKAYFELLAWFNDHESSFNFKLLKVIDKQTYGWVEFVEFLPCQNKQEVKNYHQNMGMILCIAHLLKATDLHYENLIACGEQCVLIDVETLMHSQISSELVKKNTDLESPNDHPLIHFDSVILTGLLPRWQIENDGEKTYDATGFGRFDKISHLAIDYMEEILKGFGKMYRFLMKNNQELTSNNSPIKNFSGQKCRFVFRSTKIYFALISKLTHPKFLRNGVEQSLQIEFLCRSLILYDTKKLFAPLVREEHKSIAQWDFPYFTTNSNSKDIIINNHEKITDVLAQSGYEKVINYLSNLNEEDLISQVEQIKMSFYSRIAHEKPHFSSGINKNKLDFHVSLDQQRIINSTKSIGIMLFNTKKGKSKWISPQYIVEANRYQLNPTNHSLFDGLGGIAICLSALGKFIKLTNFSDLTEQSIKNLLNICFQENLEKIKDKKININGGLGLVSSIYSLVNISKLTADLSLLKQARNLAKLIHSNLRANNEPKLDIMFGFSGTLLGFLALYKNTNEVQILEEAIFCGNHLLNNRTVSESGYRTWATLDGQLLTGFSHGAAGIAYALLRLYKATGETRLKEAAEEAIAYERSVFIPELNNWPDFRQPQTKDNPKCMCSWCHGAPGIGLARVATLDVLDTPEIRQDIEAAITTTLNYGLSDIDHLCCGNMGRVEFLFTAGRKLNRPELVDAAMKLASQVVTRAEQKGHYGYGSILDFHPSFFQGASGIGYELLRLAYPDQLPSVLLWE